MRLTNFLEMLREDDLLLEAGIRIPRDAKAAKIIFH